MASDTMPGPHAAAAAARAIEAREVDLIIGTQIVAKGWHFPHLTLVGVVDADLGLAGGDLRAAERTVQLLHQVAGRAGRAEAPGRVLLQTFIARASGDAGAGGRAIWMRSWRSEAAQRRPGHWPPYGRLAALIVSADHGGCGGRAGARSGPRGAAGDGMTVLGPAPAPLAHPARAAPAPAAAEDAARDRGAADPARVAGAGDGAARGAGGCGCGPGVVSVILHRHGRPRTCSGGCPHRRQDMAVSGECFWWDVPQPARLVERGMLAPEAVNH